MNRRIMFLLILLLIFGVESFEAEAKSCKPSGHVRGEKPPPNKCNEDHSDCCKEGELYTTYKCSPPIPVATYPKAVLTAYKFKENGDGRGPAKCVDRHYDDKIVPMVALATGWFNHKSRCSHNITITGNGGLSIIAVVVDECDSSGGCDSEHDYQKPCLNNAVGANKVVWGSLAVPEKDWGNLDVVWFDGALGLLL